jgi:hypothetical protein
MLFPDRAPAGHVAAVLSFATTVTPMHTVMSPLVAP